MSINKYSYPQEVENLPIYSELDAICDSLKDSSSHFLVLTAETAAGKSTALPLALLNNFKGNILMLEPRRIAVLNIAYRVSSLLGDTPGETCGYQMHFENKTSDKTRFTVITEAILTKKLQKDPSLEGINVIVIDEFHERSIHADLALSFIKESITLRDDLYVIVMSATMQTEKLCEYLNAPLYKVKGRQFPVDIEYAPNKSVSQIIQNELIKKEKGSILAFLPGIKEIRQTYDELLPFINCETEELLILHSSVSIKDQKYILKKADNSKRRIILSSAIAETSITVPDVTLVIDSGLSRINSYNPNTQMEHLVTVAESQFNADQRSGRAGRVSQGRCIRLWSKSDILSQTLNPEILRSDISQVIMECSAWGITDYKNIDFLDNPSFSLWENSCELLKMLGILDNDNRLTAKGKCCLEIPLNPRLSCVALSGVGYNKLDESIKLAIDSSNYAQSEDKQKEKICETIKRRILNTINTYKFTENSTVSTGFSTNVAHFMGYQDRIGLLINANEGLYQLASGRNAKIASFRANNYNKWIIATEVDSGLSTACVYNYQNITEEEVNQLITPFLYEEESVKFIDDSTKIQKALCTMYQKLEIKRRIVPITDGDYLKAIEQEVKLKGLDFLPLSNKSKTFLTRVRFYCQNSSVEESFDLQDKYDNLTQNTSQWLNPFVTSNNNLTEEEVYNALYYTLEGSVIDQKVPNEIRLENGKKGKIIYEDTNGVIKPVLEIIIQQIFGCFTTPCIMNVKIKLKLLSPARRPLQITEDLDNFWVNTWPEICSEMKGRYPKHNWDYRKTVED